jgi:hypothetical protein
MRLSHEFASAAPRDEKAVRHPLGNSSERTDKSSQATRDRRKHCPSVSICSRFIHAKETSELNAVFHWNLRETRLAEPAVTNAAAFIGLDRPLSKLAPTVYIQATLKGGFACRIPVG